MDPSYFAWTTCYKAYEKLAFDPGQRWELKSVGIFWTWVNRYAVQHRMPVAAAIALVVRTTISVDGCPPHPILQEVL